MPDSKRLRFGSFDFDPATRELCRDGMPIRLQAQPAHVLSLLLANRGSIVSREVLRNALWGSDTFVDFDRNLNFCVAQIRSALRDSAESPCFIKTLPKRGYQFIAPVAEAETNPQTAMRSTGRGPAWKAIGAVSAVVLIGAALLFGIRSRAFAPPRIAPIRVAIARFDNETEDRKLDRFAESLSDTMVAEMTVAESGKLAVIGNASLLRIPRDKRDLSAIASHLQAGYVVLGQVQQSPSGLRVLVHLIRLRDGSHLHVARLEPLTQRDIDEFGFRFAKRVAPDFSHRVVLDANSPHQVNH